MDTVLKLVMEAVSFDDLRVKARALARKSGLDVSELNRILLALEESAASFDEVQASVTARFERMH